MDLRIKLGDWFRAVQLLKSGGGAGEWVLGWSLGCGDNYYWNCAGDDILLSQAWNAIGDYYAERQKFRHAVTYYSQGRNYQQLAEAYYRLEAFTELKSLVGTLPPNSPILEVIIVGVGVGVV